MARTLKKDGTTDKRTLTGRMAKGQSVRPKGTVKAMKKALRMK